jgi:hypothetical protein
MRMGLKDRCRPKVEQPPWNIGLGGLIELLKRE